MNGEESLSDMTHKGPLDYRVELERDDNGTILVSFPDWPEAHTYGDTEEEALLRAQDALATAIDAYMKAKRPLRAPSYGPGPCVPVPSLTVAKMELYDAMRRRRVSKSALARRLNVHLPQIDRLLDVHHASRLDQLERAFEALGTRIALAFRPLRVPLVRIHRGIGSRVTARPRSETAVGVGVKSAGRARRVAARKTASRKK